MLNPERIELRNITLEELGLFWDRLGPEKRYLANPLQTNLKFAFGIRENNQLIGVGGFKTCFGMFPFTFGIMKAEFQGRGYGSSIYDGIFKYARSQSYPVVISSINAGNAPALKSSERYGFKVLHRSESHYRLGVSLNTLGTIVIKILPAFFSCYFLTRKILGKKEAAKDPLLYARS